MVSVLKFINVILRLAKFSLNSILQMRQKG